MKLKLDLYYVMTNSYTKLQVNISKGDSEKARKQKCDGQTDGLTNGQTASNLIVPRQAGRGLIKNLVQGRLRILTGHGI